MLQPEKPWLDETAKLHGEWVRSAAVVYTCVLGALSYLASSLPAGLILVQRGLQGPYTTWNKVHQQYL